MRSIQGVAPPVSVRQRHAFMVSPAAAKLFRASLRSRIHELHQQARYAGTSHFQGSHMQAASQRLAEVYETLAEVLKAELAQAEGRR